MCDDCRCYTWYVKLNDGMIAQVKVDRSDYDPDLQYTDDQLKEKLELKVQSIFMTREDFIKNNAEAGEIW